MIDLPNTFSRKTYYHGLNNITYYLNHESIHTLVVSVMIGFVFTMLFIYNVMAGYNYQLNKELVNTTYSVGTSESFPLFMNMCLFAFIIYFLLKHFSGVAVTFYPVLYHTYVVWSNSSPENKCSRYVFFIWTVELSCFFFCLLGFINNQVINKPNIEFSENSLVDLHELNQYNDSLI